MRHLFIVNDFPPITGGQASYLEHVCRSLPPREVLVLAPSWPHADSIDRRLPFQVLRRPYLLPVPLLEKPLKIMGAMFWSVLVILARKPQRIHAAHVLSTGLVAWVLKKMFRIPYVVYTHSADVMEYRNVGWIRGLLDGVLSAADHVSANSTFTANKLEELGVPRGKITVIPPRIDPQAFALTGRETELLSPYNLDGRRLILSVNRLVARKGNDAVIRALPQVLAAIPDACYVVFGRGPEEGRLKQLAREYGVDHHVVFISAGEEIKKALFHTCSVFAMVSRDIPEKGDYEGFGVVYLEAGVCAKPVVAGDSGGVRDAVVDGITGILVPPGDIEAVADALIRVITDEALAARLGEAGRLRVDKEFNSHIPFQGVPFLV